MKSGQFIRGKIDGIQKSFESSGLNLILSSEKLCELADNIEVGEYPRFFKQERCIAKTVVSAAKNSDGRRGGVINHTVLYSYDAYVEHDNEKYIFDVDAFITEILAGHRRFKMPSMPTLPDGDSGYIEAPLLEWET